LEAKEVGVIEGPIPLGVDKSLSLPLDIGPVVCKFVGRLVELNEFKNYFWRFVIFSTFGHFVVFKKLLVRLSLTF